jgi:hypothetical protein
MQASSFRDHTLQVAVRDVAAEPRSQRSLRDNLAGGARRRFEKGKKPIRASRNASAFEAQCGQET